MNTSRRFALDAGLAAGVFLMLAACRGADGAAPSSAAPAPNQSAAVSKPIEVQRREYNVTLHHEVGLPSGLVTTDVSGSLSAELKGEPGVRALRLDLRGLRAFARQQGNGGEGSFEGLEQPIWVSLEAQGQAAAVHFEPEVPASTRQLAEYVISELFQAYESDGATWQVTERDNSGTFSAEYRRDGRTLTKRKLSYSKTRSGGKLEIEKSERRLELSEQGLPTRIVGEEKLKLVDVGADVSSTSRIELSASSALTRPASWLEPSKTALRFAFGQASLQSQTESDRQLIGRTTLEQTLEQVKQQSGRDLATAMARLAAFVRQDPKALPAMQALVERGGCPPERLISPLLVSGTEAAHAQLARWLEQREPLARTRLIASELVVRDAPQRALTESIVRVAMDATHPAQPRAAHLAGSIAERHQASDPTYAASIVQRLLEAESRAPTEARVQLLGGLGNSGNALALPRLEERLMAPDATLARAATAALWRLPSARAAELLDSKLSGAPEPEVRLAAARACEQRRSPATACSALPRALQRDADPRVRVAALEAIAASTPDAVPAALKVATKDRDQSVREQAGRLSEALTRAASPRAQPSLLSLGSAHTANDDAERDRKRSM